MKVIKISDEQYSRLSKASGNTMSEKLESLLSPPVKKSKEPSGTAIIGRLFKEAYLKTYGYEYPWGAKENGQIAQWLKSVSVEQATWLVKHYMGWNSPFAVKAGHTLPILITRYMEMVSDYKNPKQKFKRLDAHHEQKEEIRKDAVSERFGESYANSRANRQSSAKIQSKTQGRIHEGDSDPFIGKGPFNLTDSDNI